MTQVFRRATSSDDDKQSDYEDDSVDDRIPNFVAKAIAVQHGTSVSPGDDNACGSRDDDKQNDSADDSEGLDPGLHAAMVHALNTGQELISSDEDISADEQLFRTGDDDIPKACAVLNAPTSKKPKRNQQQLCRDNTSDAAVDTVLATFECKCGWHCQKLFSNAAMKIERDALWNSLRSTGVKPCLNE